MCVCHSVCLCVHCVAHASLYQEHMGLSSCVSVCLHVCLYMCLHVSVQHKRRRIKSVSDDEDEEQIAEAGEDGKELIENEIFGGDDDDDEDSSQLMQQQQQQAQTAEFDLEQSDEESGTYICTVLRLHSHRHEFESESELLHYLGKIEQVKYAYGVVW